MTTARKPRSTSAKSAAVKALVDGEAGVYTFTVGTNHYALPPAAQCAPRVPAGVLIDAVMEGGDTAELKLGLSMLSAKDESGVPLVDAATTAALRALPMNEFTEHLAAWMQKSGAAPGESVSSSS